MKHSLKRLCGAGALVLPLSVWAQSPSQGFSAQPNVYDQASTSAGGSLTIFNQLQSQQDAINQLRGQIEELQHQLDEQKQLSQQRYLDLEQRLEGAGGGTSAAGGNIDNQAPAVDPINSAASGNVPAEDAGSTGAPVPANSGDAQQAYQDAFALVQARQFDQAISAFEQFNQDYPGSNLKSNAYYWLGELYSAKSQLDESAKAFQTVIDQYPDSSKMPDALYKLGLVKARQGKSSDSQKMLNRVIKDYPGSNAAKMASDFLKRTSG